VYLVPLGITQKLSQLKAILNYLALFGSFVPIVQDLQDILIKPFMDCGLLTIMAEQPNILECSGNPTLGRVDI